MLLSAENDSDTDKYKGNRPVSSSNAKIRHLQLPLPPELISEIFVHLNYSYDNISSEGTRLVSQVCSLWREIVLAEPGCWSSLTMSLSQEDAAEEASVLSTWIARSGTRPLSLSLMCHNDMETHPILPVILSAAHRWYDVDFFFPAPFFAQLSAVRGQLKLLHRLEVGESNASRHNIDTPIVDFAASAPSLSILELRLSPDRISVPWSRISDLSVSWIHTSELSSVLQKLPNLAILNVQSAYPLPLRHCFYSRNSPFVLQNLHTLYIATDAVADWLHGLQLPALRHLLIEAKGRTDLISDLLTELIAQSRFTLDTFEITSKQVRDETLIQ
ncbi:hypothetical protein B0H17DRAFT_647633 [Mycena rosella]|uniref:F-box domain-containing protein n=1 Tax=Mycena rosella TaxID=1033263 RepID=A0AAD7DE33_MYCRO|nr:hypothetical protein B0H17DRAFT_647633 [Mycena rosella]